MAVASSLPWCVVSGLNHQLTCLCSACPCSHWPPLNDVLSLSVSLQHAILHTGGFKKNSGACPAVQITSTKGLDIHPVTGPTHLDQQPIPCELRGTDHLQRAWKYRLTTNTKYRTGDHQLTLPSSTGHISQSLKTCYLLHSSCALGYHTDIYATWQVMYCHKTQSTNLQKGLAN